MIPLKLELKNFMAYRECDPIDLNGLHTVVLTGENGAGKSSLLDAMTWALWGQARARRDDELISQNETEMRVAFTFGEGRNTFQVVRTRKIGKASSKRAVATSSGQLELFVAENGTWRSLSETRQSETERKIQDTLNLSYETFINSAYLKQGRADEFAIKTPAERKTLLSEMLSLEAWQKYDTTARAKLDEIEGDEALRQSELERNEADLAGLPELQAQLAQAKTTEAQTLEKFQALEKQQLHMARLREAHSALAARIKQLEAQIASGDQERTRLTQERDQHDARLREYQAALDARDEIERGYAQLQNAQALNDALNQKMASMVDLNARRNAAERAIADAKNGLIARREVAQLKLIETQRVASDLALETKQTETSTQIATLNARQNERDTLLREQAEAAQQSGAISEQNRQLKADMLKLKSRMDALRSAGAMCDTCGRALDEQDRVRLLAELQSEGTRLGDAFRANTNRDEAMAHQKRTAEQNIKSIDGELARLPALQREVAMLEERVRLARAAQQQVQPLEREVAAALAELSTPYAGAAHEELEHVLKKLESLGYDRAAHERVRDRELPVLQAFAAKKSRLDSAQVCVLAEQRALALVAEREATVARNQAEFTQQAQQATAESNKMRTELASERDLATAAQVARSEMFAAQRKLGEAEQRVNAVRNLEEICARQRRELAATRKQKSLLKELREAFGKNGVPAMIIEVALPELEASANDLLARMTAGRVMVKFETQRLTRTQDISETLEIRIADELGERAYEMFSGGEAFRVNFAIRIALSKLLAHRQGARLQTLFIDEGFGTQDAQGREKLIEAIRAIEDDFEHIFVITHIDELKEAFPARIEVSKTEKGSVARIV